MVRMNEARIYVDLNEHVDGDIFLLAKDDTKVDSMGNIVTFMMECQSEYGLMMVMIKETKMICLQMQ